MYQRIVLAYDGSLEGRVALREGALLARHCGAKVFLLAVTPQIMVPDAWGASVVQPDVYQEILREGLARATEFGLTVIGGEMVHGDPTEEISACAKKIAADLVVVSHRRKSLLERWWSGPSQAFLVDKLECSLLVARSVISDEATEAVLRTATTPQS